MAVEANTPVSPRDPNRITPRDVRSSTEGTPISLTHEQNDLTANPRNRAQDICQSHGPRNDPIETLRDGLDALRDDRYIWAAPGTFSQEHGLALMGFEQCDSTEGSENRYRHPGKTSAGTEVQDAAAVWGPRQVHTQE